MNNLDLLVTTVLTSLYLGELIFQWRPLIKYHKPYGSRRATVFAIVKYGLSALAFLVPTLNVTRIAAIFLVTIGAVKEVGYFIMLREIKEEGGYKI